MAKLANSFVILLVALLAVHMMFWSSNTKVMAMRNLPIEFDIFEQILPSDLTIKRCGSRCKTDEDCKPRSFCSSCHMSVSRRRLACLPKKST